MERRYLVTIGRWCIILTFGSWYSFSWKLVSYVATGKEGKENRRFLWVDLGILRCCVRRFRKRVGWRISREPTNEEIRRKAVSLGFTVDSQ